MANVIFDNPPVREAIILFDFNDDIPWDLTVPGLFYEKIMHDFPVKKNMGLKDIPSNIKMKKRMRIMNDLDPYTPIMRFENKDNNSSIQLSPYRITSHQIKPYDGWVNFSLRSIEMFNKYSEIVGDISFSRCAVRFINNIEINSPVELSEYFNTRPIWPDFPESSNESYPEASAFLLLNNPSSSLHFRFSMKPITENQKNITFVLDLSVISCPVNEEDHDGNYLPKPDSLADWLNISHERLENFFMASFTERTHNEIFMRRKANS